MSDKDILTVKVTGHDELVRDLRKASKEIQDEARKILNSQAKVVRDHIKSRCPVGDGVLQRSIKANLSRKALLASVKMGGGKAYYAPYVEFGTKNMSARAFFYNTARLHEDETHEKLTDMMTKKLKEASGDGL